MKTQVITDRGRDANFVPTGMAARRLNRHPDTLRAMKNRGEIEVIRTATGRLLWNVDEFIARMTQQVRAA